MNLFWSFNYNLTPFRALGFHHVFSPGEKPAAYRALAVLAKAARDCVGNFRPQDVSMVSLALARMSWDDPRLMKAMASRTTETLRAFK